MAQTADNLNIQILSYSYVAVWKNIIQQGPILGNDALSKAWSKYSKIQTGVGPDGFVAMIPDLIPSPTITIGPQKIMFFDTNKEDLISLYNVITTDLKDNHQEFYAQSLIGAFGINIELEVSGFNKHIVEWMSEKFLSSKMQEAIADPIFTADLQFTILEDQAKDKRTIVRCQPRANNVTGLYVSFNDHFGLPPHESLFTEDELRKHIEETVKKITNKLLPQLLNQNGNSYHFNLSI